MFRQSVVLTKAAIAKYRQPKESKNIMYGKSEYSKYLDEMKQICHLCKNRTQLNT